MRTDHTSHCVVDQGVEIFDAGSLKLFLVLVVVDLLEDVLEGVVVLLGDGVLGCEPDILMQIQTVVEAGTCKAGDGVVLVVQTLYDAVGILKLKISSRLSLPLRQ